MKLIDVTAPSDPTLAAYPNDTSLSPDQHHGIARSDDVGSNLWTLHTSAHACTHVITNGVPARGVRRRS